MMGVSVVIKDVNTAQKLILIMSTLICHLDSREDGRNWRMNENYNN